jgi:hypothetical protein
MSAASRRLNTALLVPMPSARVRTTAAVNVGRRRSGRRAYRKSLSID